MSQKATTILRGTENEVKLLTVTAGDCLHVRTMSDFNKQKVNIE